jgi:hypothetical protein
MASLALREASRLSPQIRLMATGTNHSAIEVAASIPVQ